jgi:phosphoenolpyruvate---glycerone phosphotransferase subunit DhaL
VGRLRLPVDRDSVTDWMQRFAASIHEHRDELVRLDREIGDGDHGTNMDRGMRKALEALDSDEQQDPGTVLRTVAMALVSSVGGAAGPLYGTLFLQLGNRLSGVEDAGLSEYATAWRKGVEAVQARGKAELGDKTMIDALLPAVQALEEASELDGGLRDAASAAERGMRETIPLVARKGRASYLGDRSRGHQDPGATSAYYLCQTAAEALAS